MKNKLPVILSIIAIIAIVLIYIFTRHTHTFADANCTTAKMCECGETEGEPIGHTWLEATCTEPKQCSVCGITEGQPLGHKFSESTCTEDAICLTCGAIGEKAKGHDFKEADYANPKTCQLCGLTEGEPLPVEETVTDGVDSTSTDVILGEGEYKGDEIDIKSFDEATQNVLNRAKELYEAGLLSKEEYDEVVKDATGLNNLVGELQNSQPGHIDKDVPGGTPDDPSQYGQYHLGQGGELPPELKGRHTQ